MKEIIGNRNPSSTTLYSSFALSFDFPVTVLVIYDNKNSESRIKETLFPMYFPL